MTKIILVLSGLAMGLEAPLEVIGLSSGARRKREALVWTTISGLTVMVFVQGK